MSKKQKNGGNRTAGIIKILIYAVLVLFCIFVFLLYGKKQRSIEAAPEPEVRLPFKTETVNVTPSPIPKLSPQELVSGLQSAGLDCVITQRSTLTDGSLECSLMLNRISGDGRLVVKPDSNGGTAECILEFNYILCRNSR